MNRPLVIAVLGIFFALVAASPVKPDAEKKVVCYFGSWAAYRPGNGQMEPEDIDPFLCTHIIYGFAGMGPDNKLLVLDPYNDLEENFGKGAMKRFTNLKQQNPNLKTLLAVGGWNEGSQKYSQMASDPVKRRTFIESVAPLLVSQNFDGLDFDWEYPGSREGSTPEDKQNFVILLNELREAFQPRGFLLTAAVSGQVDTIDAGYDVPAVSAALDFLNVMTYDFYGAVLNVTEHYSPLYNNPAESCDDILKTANNSIQYWLSRGAAPEKLILGLGSYGRGFLLADPSNHGYCAPISQHMPGGPYTREPGFLGYNEICEKMQAEPGNWTVVNDEIRQVQYTYSGNIWFGYESTWSVANKARFVNQLGLGGGMVWSLDTDDFRGVCGPETFPLVKSFATTLNGE